MKHPTAATSAKTITIRWPVCSAFCKIHRRVQFSRSNQPLCGEDYRSITHLLEQRSSLPHIVGTGFKIPIGAETRSGNKHRQAAIWFSQRREEKSDTCKLLLIFPVDPPLVLRGEIQISKVNYCDVMDHLDCAALEPRLEGRTVLHRKKKK